MSTQNEPDDVVIVGAGPARMCTALYTGRARGKTALLERGIPGGELLSTEYLDDVVGWPMILGRDLTKAFIDHALQFGAELHTDETESVTKRADGMFETKCASGRVFESPTVVVTAGGTPVKLGVPGELEYAGRGVSYCATCDANFFVGETICVVGGGDLSGLVNSLYGWMLYESEFGSIRKRSPNRVPRPRRWLKRGAAAGGSLPGVAGKLRGRADTDIAHFATRPRLTPFHPFCNV